MRVCGITVSMADTTRFFSTREPLITAAKNCVERQKRLEWLAEGCLEHMLYPDSHNPEMRFGTDGGVPAERDMWIDFLAWRQQQRRCAAGGSGV